MPPVAKVNPVLCTCALPAAHCKDSGRSGRRHRKIACLYSYILEWALDSRLEESCVFMTGRRAPAAPFSHSKVDNPTAIVNGRRGQSVVGGGALLGG